MPPGHGPGDDDVYPCMTPFLKPGLYRALHADEIATLVKNNNYAESWAEIFVTGAFKANLIVNCEFYGRVLIGDLTPRFIEYHDLRLPVGIRNSTIMSCRIGDNVAIRDVHYLAHYVIGNDCTHTVIPTSGSRRPTRARSRGSLRACAPRDVPWKRPRISCTTSTPRPWNACTWWRTSPTFRRGSTRCSPGG
jgi:hypothetical protein